MAKNYVRLADRESVGILAHRREGLSFNPERDMASRRHCIYCGDYFEARDHVVPVTWAGVTRQYRPGDTVACCRLCNAMLNNSAVHTVEDMAIFLHKRYSKKRERFINLPDWSMEEIDAMGYGMKMRILGGLHMKELILRKLENLELVMYGLDAVPLHETQYAIRYANEKANKN